MSGNTTPRSQKARKQKLRMSSEPFARRMFPSPTPKCSASSAVSSRQAASG